MTSLWGRGHEQRKAFDQINNYQICQNLVCRWFTVCTFGLTSKLAFWLMEVKIPELNKPRVACARAPSGQRNY
jgi:hypothetical protein